MRKFICSSCATFVLCAVFCGLSSGQSFEEIVSRTPAIRVERDAEGNVVSVEARGPRVNDNFLSQLAAHFPFLKSLIVEPDDPALVTDAGIQALRVLLHLKYLDLSRTNMTDESMTVIADMRLDGLAVGPEVTNLGIAPLKDHTSIEYLDLSGTGITDKELSLYVSKMPKLKSLVLKRTKVTNDGIDSLKGHPSLEFVSLHATGVDTSLFARLHSTLNGDLNGLAAPVLANLSGFLLSPNTVLSDPEATDLAIALGWTNLTLEEINRSNTLGVSVPGRKLLQQCDRIAISMRQLGGYVEFRELPAVGNAPQPAVIGLRPEKIAFIRTAGEIDHSSFDTIPRSIGGLEAGRGKGVAELSLYDRKFPASALRHLHGLPDLRKLNLDKTGFGSEEGDFLYLANLMGVTDLRISGLIPDTTQKVHPDVPLLVQASALADAFQDAGAFVQFGTRANARAVELTVVGLDVHENLVEEKLVRENQKRGEGKKLTKSDYLKDIIPTLVAICPEQNGRTLKQLGVCHVDRISTLSTVGQAFPEVGELYVDFRLETSGGDNDKIANRGAIPPIVGTIINQLPGLHRIDITSDLDDTDLEKVLEKTRLTTAVTHPQDPVARAGFNWFFDGLTFQQQLTHLEEIAGTLPVFTNANGFDVPLQPYAGPLYRRWIKYSEPPVLRPSRSRRPALFP